MPHIEVVLDNRFFAQHLLEHLLVFDSRPDVNYDATVSYLRKLVFR